MLRRPFDAACVLFLLSHIPVTIFIDSQSVFPREWYPGWATDTLDWFIRVPFYRTKHDPLVSANPTWFLALVWAECIIQLPTFFVLAYGLAFRKNWVRLPCIVYGVHVTTTLLPILAEIAVHPKIPSSSARVELAAIYSPYLIFPATLAVRMLAAGEYPYDEQIGEKAKRA